MSMWKKAAMFLIRKKYVVTAVVLFMLASGLFFAVNRKQPEVPASAAIPADAVLISTAMPARIPEKILIADGPLKKAIIAAGDYLVRQQLPNGELSYQVDFMTGERAYSPSHVRLMAGTGSLFTVCRVSGDLKYCDAGDLALNHYLELLVNDPENFKGTCLYTEGTCQLGGAALTVDAIYKRWQATGDFSLKDRNLLNTAIDLGYFIASMRKPEGGFYHAFDPYFGGAADPNFYVTYSSSESLVALMDLYEMTGDESWLKQAHEVNAFMISQPVTEDHWHSYALSKLVRLDSLTKEDKAYAEQIAKTIIAGEVRSLNPKNTSISTATKIEALAALAQAFYLSGAKHEWLDPEIRTFITFVQARQLPDNNCGWDISMEVIKNFGGGIFSSCDEATIRIDGLQNWINGVTAYLEYRSMINSK
jgi:hypothetical protein